MSTLYTGMAAVLVVIMAWLLVPMPDKTSQLLVSPNLSQSSSQSADPRQSALALALEQRGKPYILGTEGPDTFDCSGLIEWVYAAQDIATTRTTFTQLDALRPIGLEDVQPGDMVYFQFPWDQHVGMLFDADGDGLWDMVHAGSPDTGVIVSLDVLHDPFYVNNIIGFRSVR